MTRTVKLGTGQLLAWCAVLLMMQAVTGIAQDRPGSADSGWEPNFTPPTPVGPVITARPGDAQVLDLGACVAEALQTNDLLRAERLRRAELNGQMKQALATGLPTVDLVGDWSRGRDPSFALDSTFGGDGGFPSVPGADPWFGQWLQGFGSFIPFDEVVDTLLKIGKSMPSDLRCTSRGGLAVTPTALATCRKK